MRAEDVFTAFVGKMLDMDSSSIAQHFVAFMEAWF